MSKRLTTEEFIIRARNLHGDRYDYSLVEYIGSKSKVKIICPEHGIFEQTPSNHSSLKNGCSLCAIDRKAKQQYLTTEEFIKNSREIHGDRYNYSLVKYAGVNTPVKITCSEHGVFKQTPNNHINMKQGCPQCGGTSRLTNKEFIIRAAEIHGDRYSYSLVEYANNKSKVNIICPDHGVFEQTPHAHLRGQGCPQCAQTGFNPLEPSVLYVLADNKQCPTLLKIGIANNLKQRLRNLRRNTPHPVVKLVVYPFSRGADAYKLEQEVHQTFSELNVGMNGFDGATEWFRYSGEILDYIRKRV